MRIDLLNRPNARSEFAPLMRHRACWPRATMITRPLLLTVGLMCCEPAAPAAAPARAEPTLVPASLTQFRQQPFMSETGHLIGVDLEPPGVDCLQLRDGVTASVNGHAMRVQNRGGYGQLAPRAYCAHGQLLLDASRDDALWDELRDAPDLVFELGDSGGNVALAYHFDAVSPISVTDLQPDDPITADRDHVFRWAGGGPQASAAASYVRADDPWCIFGGCRTDARISYQDSGGELRVRRTGDPGDGRLNIVVTYVRSDSSGTFTSYRSVDFTFYHPLE